MGVALSALDAGVPLRLLDDVERHLALAHPVGGRVGQIVPSAMGGDVGSLQG